MKKHLLFLFLTIASFNVYGQEYISLAMRAGIGVSSLKGFDRSEIFKKNGLNNISTGSRLTWDVGFALQAGMGGGFFFQTEANVGMLGASIEGMGTTYGDVTSVDVSSFQSCNYFGKKIVLGEDTRFFVGLGLYVDFMMDTLIDSDNPEFIDKNFKDWDFGATMMTGIDYGNLQFSINPQIGFIDLTRDRPSVFNRAFKIALTYHFFCTD